MGTCPGYYCTIRTILDIAYVSGKCNSSNGADETPPAAKEDDEECDNDGKHQSSRSIVTVPGLVHSVHLWLLGHHDYIALQRLKIHCYKDFTQEGANIQLLPKSKGAHIFNHLLVHATHTDDSLLV